jgi:hypothetical protein
VRGRILEGACGYHEFRVLRVDDSTERATFEVETVASGQLRPFFGWNRAKHAVLEAAILATRVAVLPIRGILEELERLAAPVKRTAGPDEAAAFALLRAHIHAAARRQGIEPETHR